MNTRPSPHLHRPEVSGFTVIELMTVVAVLGVLIAIAAPSFTPIIERWRVRTAAENMMSTLHYARSEAIKRATPVIVEPMPTSAACNPPTGRPGMISASYACGWRVFVAKNDNDEQYNDAGLLRIVEISPKVSANAAAHATRSTEGGASYSSGSKFIFNRWGMPKYGQSVSFYPQKEFSDMNAAIANGRKGYHTVCVASSGMIKLHIAKNASDAPGCSR